MTAYYNEFDPYAAQWLRNLIAAGHIAPGEVDERSILDVAPDDLRGFAQCHFFAGIGLWSLALRQAGWPDDRPVWTGSCPCQPFSAAGKGEGFADERHLWPAWHHLIRVCRPPVVFGEQVAKKDGLAWLDLLQADLEGVDYACGAIVAPASGFGAPHIRERQYIAAYDLRLDRAGGVADSAPSGRREECADGGGCGCGDSAEGRAAGSLPGGDAGGVENAQLPEGQRQRQHCGADLCGQKAMRPAGASMDRQLGAVRSGSGMLCRGAGDAKRGGGAGELEQPGGQRRERGQRAAQRGVDDRAVAGWAEGDDGAFCADEAGPFRIERPGPTNGFWRDADWLYCRDGKWRPVGPGTFPLAHGSAARVGRLRAYGNAIVPAQAAEVIRAAMEATNG